MSGYKFNTGHILFLISLFTIFFMNGCNLRDNAYGANNYSNNSELMITVEPSHQSLRIKNVFSDVNIWDFHKDWMSKALKFPADYFRKHYPFVKEIQFMTATGGNNERDLFIHPNNRAVLKDYKFTDLVTALRQVVRQGLKPRIITGNVPLKYSKDPAIGAFGVNTRPPFNYNVYFAYIKALADTLVKAFGIKEVKTWTWGVLTEYENKDWFLTENNNPKTTEIAYFKLYDYTVAALEAAIGARNLFVGAHSMTVSKGIWDERDFIDHVAKGINYKTGEVGTQIDFLSSSFYDSQPGIPVKDSRTLKKCINLLRQRAERDGLENLQYGIDEGRILSGPPEDNRPLLSRTVALSFQGASDAKIFKTMVDLNADWFSTWSLNTKGIWGGIPTVGTHISMLSYKMVGDKRIKLTVSGNPDNKVDKINGVASINNEKGVIHLMLYNYNNKVYSISSENIKIIIKHISAIVKDSVNIKYWIINDKHGNFWPTWASDMRRNGITNKDFNWSKFSVEIPESMNSNAAKTFWYSKVAEYKLLAALDSVKIKRRIFDNELHLNAILGPHSVLFYEISNIHKTK